MSRVFIDNTDLAVLGMFILKGGDFDLLSFPERKKPPQNDWFEHDGLDCDLSEVLFEAKKVKISYFLMAENSTVFQQRLNAFETLHYQPGLRKLKVEAFNRTYQLRTLKFSKYEHKGGLVKTGKKSATIEVIYSMDNPLQLFTGTYDIPNLNRSHLTYVTLNGFDFSKFGVIIQKAYHTLLQPASPKLGIEWKSKYSTGIIADTNYIPKKRSHKLTLECTMLTDTPAEFEYNYTALFRQLTKPGTIEIGIKNGAIPCYYSKMSNFKKKRPIKNGALITFNLELITTWLNSSSQITLY